MNEPTVNPDLHKTDQEDFISYRHASKRPPIGTGRSLAAVYMLATPAARVSDGAGSASACISPPMLHGGSAAEAAGYGSVLTHTLTNWRTHEAELASGSFARLTVVHNARLLLPRRSHAYNWTSVAFNDTFAVGEASGWWRLPTADERAARCKQHVDGPALVRWPGDAIQRDAGPGPVAPRPALRRSATAAAPPYVATSPPKTERRARAGVELVAGGLPLRALSGEPPADDLLAGRAHAARHARPHRHLHLVRRLAPAPHAPLSLVVRSKSRQASVVDLDGAGATENAAEMTLMCSWATPIRAQSSVDRVAASLQP